MAINETQRGIGLPSYKQAARDFPRPQRARGPQPTPAGGAGLREVPITGGVMPAPRRLRVGPSLWLNVTVMTVYK